MGIIQKIKQNMEEYAENHTPDEVQDMSPQQELLEDLRDPMFKSLAACLAVTGYILSGFGVGYIVVIFKYFTIDVDMLLILKYGFLSWWANLFNILFALICVGVAYKLFRATRKNYMLNKKPSKKNVAVREYEFPNCEVSFEAIQELICTSETELVDETDGEW